MVPDVQLTIRISADLSQRLDRFVLDHPDQSKSGAASQALDQFLPKPIVAQTRALPGAGQDADTGRAGRDFGVSAGRKIAEHYGRLVSPVAAKFVMADGRKATVRTAKERNTQWGCLDSIRDEVDVILCAYAKDGRTFDIWEVLPSGWREKMRPAAKNHKLHGKLTLISKSDMPEIGKKLDGQFTLPPG